MVDPSGTPTPWEPVCRQLSDSVDFRSHRLRGTVAVGRAVLVAGNQFAVHIDRGEHIMGVGVTDRRPDERLLENGASTLRHHRSPSMGSVSVTTSSRSSCPFAKRCTGGILPSVAVRTMYTRRANRSFNHTAALLFSGTAGADDLPTRGTRPPLLVTLRTSRRRERSSLLRSAGPGSLMRGGCRRGSHGMDVPRSAAFRRERRGLRP